jgi:hypothetical protein
MATAATTALRGFRDALTAHDCAPRGTAARCPAHDDQRASLSFGPATQFRGVVVHCQRGCTIDDILNALGLVPADLFDEPRQAEQGNAVVAEYRYVDEANQVLHVKQRRWPKGFRQYRPLPGGGREWNLNGTRRVLYQLPSVVAAVKAEETIYLAEGEKDADSLKRAGVVATTWTEGAWQPGAQAKWRAEYSKQLTGATVVVVRDRDASGRQTARDIAAELKQRARSVKIVEPAKGKDVTEHLAAGLTVSDLVPVTGEAETGTGDHESTDDAAAEDEGSRRVLLTAAADIKPRRVRWLWDNRLAVGILALLAGQEGLGKSILAFTIAAMITRGTLPGEYFGTPKSLLVAAAEDPWPQVIVPRLIAADADLKRVQRVEIMTDTVHSELTLPKDLPAVKKAARETDAVLLILDPLISRLDDRLDTHKDAEVRRALEPLVAAADEANLTVLGLIHHNKSGSSDPLQVVMASKAFPAVARSVHTVVPDPDDDSGARRLFGTPKNNLGRSDLPTLGFTIDSYPVETEDDDLAWTGRLVWGDDSRSSIHEAMRHASETPEQKSAAAEAAEWLDQYLTSKGGTDKSANIKVAGRKAGHSDSAIHRARKRLKLTVESIGYPCETWWSQPGTQTEKEDAS